ncbi:uncharacterized protein ARMOST_10074 [Armillaria ostoyae]|uniref:Uncharacterized protein n=1 Tax=Armillaria ostoyae TaxID=47428 RepID=A0A284RD87_ARMOS|nr:uncharacterized protein ARMOST_10074 [Armillaria ostoyae]
MGNTEEAIANYIKKTKCNQRVTVAKITTPSSHALAMILDHNYQANDGTQKWVKNPDETLWKEFLDEYWANQADAQYDSPEEEP